MRIKIWITIAVGAALSAVTLYLALRNVPLADLSDYLRTYNYVWLIPTVGFILISFLLRTLRWQLILHSTYPLKFRQAFHPLMIGFLMNCVLPGRVGEIARPLILRQRYGIAISTGLATVAIERILDMVFLMALFSYIFSTISRQPQLEVVFGNIYLNNHTLQTLVWVMIRLVLSLLAGLILLMTPWFRRWLVRLLHKSSQVVGMILPSANNRAHHVAQFLIHLLQNFALGLNLLYNPRRLIACSVVTISIWGISLFSYYVFSKGSPNIDLSLLELTTVMVVICFFIVLPSVPGFWGLWEAGGVFALSLFGVASKEAAGFTLLNHAAQIFPVILVGWMSALAISVNIWQVSGKHAKESIIQACQPSVDERAMDDHSLK